MKRSKTLEERIENLKNVLHIDSKESIVGLQLTHEEFVQQIKEKKVYIELPKRDINVFYAIPNYPVKQVILQILLIPFWGLHILGIVLLFKAQWLDGVLSFVFAWTWKPLINYYYRRGIKVALYNKVVS